MPASRFLKIVKKLAKFQSAVSMCQFLSPGTLLYVDIHPFLIKKIHNIHANGCVMWMAYWEARICMCDIPLT